MRRPVYLDHHSTTPLDPRVFDAMKPMLLEEFGNASSSTHPYGWFAEEKVTIAREHVAALIGCKPHEIIFTSGATESINLAILGASRAASRAGRSPHLITVATEHRAVLETAESLRLEGWTVDVLPVRSDGFVEESVFRSMVRDDTALVSIMLGNNEIGVVEDVARFVAIAREKGALTHCDATQAVGKVGVDVDTLGVDLLSGSAHKLYGPKGVGFLYIRPHTPLLRLQFGGKQEQGIRPGTLNVPGIVGFGEAARIASTEMTSDAARLSQLGNKLLTSLMTLGDVTLNGDAHRRLPGSLNVTIAGVESTRLLTEVAHKVALSINSACLGDSGAGSHVLSAVGLSEEQQRQSFRIALGRFTTADEITFACETILSAATKLRSQQSS